MQVRTVSDVAAMDAVYAVAVQSKRLRVNQESSLSVPITSRSGTRRRIGTAVEFVLLDVWADEMKGTVSIIGQAEMSLETRTRPTKSRYGLRRKLCPANGPGQRA